MLTLFIPAKGTSLAIPKKNIQKIDGRTLTSLTLIAAIDSQLANRIVLSTDSVEIANELIVCEIPGLESFSQPKVDNLSYVGSKNNLQFFVHWRKPSDATPTSPTIDSVKNFLELEKYCADVQISQYLMLLQPTSPFRTSGEIDRVIELFLMDPDLPLASIKEIQSPHPLKTFELGEDSFAYFSSDDIERLTSPRQKLDQRFAFDGAYYLNSVKNIHATNALIGPKTRTFLRAGDKTINIDSPDDLMLATIISQKSN